MFDNNKLDSAPSEGVQGYTVNLCYCDESGIGDEPIATMVGIVVDASRMHLTKVHWEELLKVLSKLAGHQIVELHTRDFYSGNGVFRDIGGEDRSEIISQIFEWLCRRKHHVVYASVLKDSYYAALKAQEIPDELNTPWRFLGFHLVLAMQKRCQRDTKNKGHTIFVFDNEERERMRFTDIITRPPTWSDVYYQREKKQGQLDQIVDTPYFGDSKEVSLIQLADFMSFFLRRYAEIKEQVVAAKYADEEQKIGNWIAKLASRSIGCACIYPKTGRDYAENLFYQNAPDSIRNL
ncbi:MAG: DUF3800 domain-containing protein [Dehalococcoidia bacterium]|jgi:hypothetical protein